MKNRVSQCLVVVSLLVVSSAVPQARADVKLPKVFGSHMVLQRDRPLPVWGWADPGEEVTVKLDEATAAAKADAQGNWKVVLPAVKADGKAHHMTVSGKNKIELDDILIGEVWIGSGQSNMEMGLAMCQKGKEEVAAANHPNIRLLLIPRTVAKEPAKDVKSQWVRCQPDTVAAGGWNGFSAALYYFGLRLHKDLDVPIGLIESAWGGSPIEPWTIAGGKGGQMYNGMIAPVNPLAIRGAIWYQGEANVSNGLKYYDQMKALIAGWRGAWGYDFPFYFVQLAPFSNYSPGALPPLWEAQVASLKVPHTGMAVTTDLVDNLGDIHPRNKFDVGNRLALWALAKDYKRDLVYSGPLYKGMKLEGHTIRLAFAHVGGGLKSRDGKPLSEFEIAGADGKFVPATATIDGDRIVVQAKEVAKPAQVRFGWRNVANPNLVNKEGLPASPFRTDHWQGGTGEDMKTVAVSHDGAAVMEISVPQSTEVTTDKEDKEKTVLDTKDMNLDLWVVPKAKTVAEAIAGLDDVIKSEVLKFNSTGTETITVADAPAKHLMGTGLEADDHDAATVDVVVFTVGKTVLVACVHGEGDQAVRERQPMLKALETVKAP